MADGGDSWSVGDWHVPTVVAVALWGASALTVLGFTVEAFLKTVSGEGDQLDAAPPGQGPITSRQQFPGAFGEEGPQGPVNAGGPIVRQGPQGPVNAGGPLSRGKFTPSPEAPYRP